MFRFTQYSNPLYPKFYNYLKIMTKVIKYNIILLPFFKNNIKIEKLKNIVNHKYIRTVLFQVELKRDKYTFEIVYLSSPANLTNASVIQFTPSNFLILSRHLTSGLNFRPFEISGISLKNVISQSIIDYNLLWRLFSIFTICSRNANISPLP